VPKPTLAHLSRSQGQRPASRPAGLSAALVLTRAPRRVAVVDVGQPRNAPAAHIHGYLGPDGLPPSSLPAAGRREVTGTAGTSEGVADVRQLPADGARAAAGSHVTVFALSLADGTVLHARRVLVTTGQWSDDVVYFGQVITAAGEGSTAAIAINNDLVEEDIPIAVTNFRLGLPVPSRVAP
jgi:thioredoxin reductase